MLCQDHQNLILHELIHCLCFASNFILRMTLKSLHRVAVSVKYQQEYPQSKTVLEHSYKHRNQGILVTKKSMVMLLTMVTLVTKVVTIVHRSSANSLLFLCSFNHT